ncbi:MAG: rhodanese-like domain-containing protein [Sulfurovaceae bacterium]|nr:rhodanese-like domain-containing protein [Sulfurovaceae bacterium]
MKKIFLLFSILTLLIHADVTNVVATKAFLNKPIKIIDIRTPAEWAQSGIIKGSYPIMFFNEKGEAKEDAFLVQLNKIVKKNETFAIICRTGSRTTAITPFLDEKDYNVINLQGGIIKLIQEGYKPVPYRAR